MDFSEVFRSPSACFFSPNARFFAYVSSKSRLVVKDVATLEAVQIFTCLDDINLIEWSSDSRFIFAAQYRRALVQVFNLDEPKWTCKIEEGPAGLTYARWSPDGRHILTASDFNLRLTVWSLVNRSVSYVKHPKFSGSTGIDFTKDGKYMAVVERKESKDYINLITCETWELVKAFPVDTLDLANISFSPDSRVLCVWDSCLEYKICIYSLDGRLLASHKAYENALGIKSVSWSPSSQFLAVGSYDQKVRIFNHLTWKVLTEFEHTPQVQAASAIVFREVEYIESEIDAPLQSGIGRTRYIVEEGTVDVPIVPPELEAENLKLGVGTVLWSSDGRYLATRNDNMPRAVWIWDMATISLVVVILQLRPVTSVRWDPKHPRLALSTGGGRVYLWSPIGCSCVDVPVPDFNCTTVKWNSDGDSLALKARDGFCLCYPAYQE